MSPLGLEGRAQLVHMNARKEGPEDDKILATDLKFSLVTENDILIAFHPQLRMMLFTKEGDPRFPLMGAVDWDYDFRDMTLELDPWTLGVTVFRGVKLKKWSFQPQRGGKVLVTFQAQVKPDHGQFERLGQFLLTEEVAIRVQSSNGDLFEEKKPAPRAPAEPEAAPEEGPSSFPPAGPDVGAETSSGAAIEPEPERQPAAELTEALLTFMRTAGASEARKLEDERDFDVGFAAAWGNAGLPKEFVEENLAELQKAFADGYDDELASGE